MGVREEAVRLTVTGDFTSEMVKAAAAAALLEHNLDSLNGTALRSSRGTTSVTREANTLTQSLDKGRSSIDQYSGRLSLLGSLAGAVAPSLIPIAAIGVPAVSGLAAQFGFAALAGGTMIGAFQGVGDALTAMNKAALEPSAENLQAAKLAMEEISPAAQDLVKQLRSMGPAMKQLRDVAASGMFPGFIEGLESMETLLPTVQRIVGAVAGELGSIAADSGASLASDRWADFFTFLETDAPSALRDMATAAGNTGHAMAEMWMDFDPLNDDFSSWLVDSTGKLDDWATGLDQTEGFQEFVDYIRTTGPQVADTLGAIASAAVQIVQAAAPIAGPILQGIEAFAKVIGTVADSDLGTPIFGMVAALSALNLAMRATGALSKVTFGGTAVGRLTQQVTGYKGIAAAQREVRTATADLAKAEQARAAAATRAAGIQPALVAPGQKRGAVSEYVAAAKAQETAAKRVTEAEKARSAAVRSGAVAAGKAGAVVAGLAVATTGLGDKIGVTNTASLALMGSMAGGWGAALGAAAGAAIDLAHANDDLRESADAAMLAMNNGSVDEMADAYGNLAAKVKETNDVGFWDPGDADAGLKKILGHVTGAIGDAEEAQSNLAAAAAANTMMSIGQQFQQSTQAAAAGFNVTGDAAEEAAMSVKELTAAMERANAAMGAISAEDALRTALLNTRDLLKENGKVLNENGEALKGHARAGIAARAGLVSIGSAAQEASTKMKAGFEKTKFLDDARRNFVRLATSMGMSRAAAQRMADDFDLLDRLHAAPKVTVKGALEAASHVKGVRGQIALLKGKIVQAKAQGAKESSPLVQALRAQIDKLKGKTVPVKVNGAQAAISAARAVAAAINAINPFKSVTIQTRRTHIGDPVARGGIFADNVRTYAYGDVANRHQPELAGPGPTRIWREPETQGEAYIPLANDDRRPRARAIAAETVSLLGGTAHFANGGMAFARGGVRTYDDEVARAHRAHAEAVRGSTKEINKEKAARGRLITKRDNLSSGLRDTLLTDPFGETGNVWAAGAGDPRATLRADIAKANQFKNTLGALKKSGLDGDAFAAVAATGDVGKANAVLGLGKAGINQYESLYKQRAIAVNATSKYAGQAAYGPAIAQINHHLAALTREVRTGNRDRRSGHDKTGKAVGREINRVAAHVQRGKRG